jgi:D-arabinose 1-dehydrogenase-like Zn-dependent alcohol dehydrogenase
MKAAVCERYGPPEVVQIKEVPKPVPADGGVLVKVLATTVNSGDTRVRALRVPRGLGLPMRLRLGLTKPKQPILDFEMAGQVESVGTAVTSFQPGVRVVASRGFDFGCHAEHVTVAEQGAMARIPENLSYQDAVALCFGGTTALTFFRLRKLASGETILINGASGAVGTMAVQLAKRLGAEVTGVCSGANAELVRGLGADHVIDYTTEDFTRNGQHYEELLQLDVEHLDVANRQTQIIGKGGAAERIRWDSEAARLLIRLVAGRRRGPVFLADLAPSPARQPTAGDVDPDTGRARLSYRRAAELFKAASGGRTLHKLRHSRLTHLAEAGEDVTLIKALSRHGSLRSLERYVNPSNAAIARLTDCHDPNGRRA